MTNRRQPPQKPIWNTVLAWIKKQPAFRTDTEYRIRLATHETLDALSLNQRAWREIKHNPPMRAISCALVIMVLGAALAGYNLLPINGFSQNASINSLVRGTRADIVFTASFVGDIMMGRGVQSAARAKGYDACFQYVSDFFVGCDVVLGNLEHQIINEGDQYTLAERSIYLSAGPECLPAIKNAGFTMLGFANNHMMDYGAKALLNTMEAVDQAGISYVGIGSNIDEAMRYQLLEYDGVKIAVLAVSDIVEAGLTASKQTPGVFSTKYLNPNYLGVVADAAAAADVVIVYMHWGNEYTAIPTGSQNEIGRQLIDAGANIVLGSHSHAIQPIEIYNGGIIFYGLGNFITDQGWSRTKDSCLVRYCLDIAGRGAFEVVPLRINDASVSETRNPIFTQRIFHTLTKNLASGDYTLENNRLYIYPPALGLAGNVVAAGAGSGQIIPGEPDRHCTASMSREARNYTLNCGASLIFPISGAATVFNAKLGWKNRLKVGQNSSQALVKKRQRVATHILRNAVVSLGDSPGYCRQGVAVTAD